MTNEIEQFVDAAAARIGREADKCIPILQAIQAHWRWLPPEALARVCEVTEITAAQIAGVSTFYTQFRHRPMGLHLVRVCHGTACHVKGAPAVTDALRRALNLPDGEDTDADGRFTLQKVACLGCCTLAPAVQIDEVTYGHLTADAVAPMLRDFLALRERAAAGEALAPLAGATGGAEVRVGLGSCCVARGSGEVWREAHRTLAELGSPATLKTVGCVGMCHQTPLLEIVLPHRPTRLYARVGPGDARAILLRHLRSRGPLRAIRAAVSRGLDAMLTVEGPPAPARSAIDPREGTVEAFLGPQKHLATEHYGVLGPTDLDEYLRFSGFEALRRCLRELSPQDVLGVIAASGLRGRGGAGYPSAAKWASVRAAPSGKKYVVCNGDEGDPGAFMDRMLLESYPYRVIEGLAIGAYAVGADEGVLYIRAEYPLAVRRVREALTALERRGLLGERVAGSGFSLRLRVMEGAGAFVCGEETALLASLEGRRGIPRHRPPYPALSGLRGKPTLVNNVETFALVPWIFRHGPEAFAALGTAGSKGTKVFALAGKVARGGLIEVPMGATIRQVVEEIGGGVAGGKRFKAVQVGGPSGGCVPAALADVAIDYEALHEAGAIMGSGGLVVLDETDCMVEIARYFLEFTQDQSCGRCTFCRIGTRRMLEILSRLCEGRARPDDLERLEALARQVKAGSLCGLGRTAPNPVLSTLRHFRDEYEAHLAGRCPAGRCKALIRFTIGDDCIGCTLCAQKCPSGAIAMRPYERHEIDPDKCVRCGACRDVCPEKAMKAE